MTGVEHFASWPWWCKHVASLSGVKGWCRLICSCRAIHNAFEASTAENDADGLRLLPLRIVSVVCSDQVRIMYYESNIGYKRTCERPQAGWTGPAAQMPMVPVAVDSINIRKDLRNLATLLSCCVRPRAIDGDATEKLGFGAMALLRHAVRLRRHQLCSAGEGLVVPSEIFRILADTNMKDFTFSDSACSGLSIFFARPRKANTMSMYFMPEDGGAWNNFTRNVVGLRRFRIPSEARLRDITFLLDRKIVELCGCYCDYTVELLQQATLEWKSRVVRIGIRADQVDSFTDTVLADLSSLEHVVINTWVHDTADHDPELIPRKLYTLCQARQIRVTDISDGDLEYLWDDSPQHTLVTDIVDDFECLRHPSVDHDDVRALCISDNSHVANALRAMGVSSITSAGSLTDESLRCASSSFDCMFFEGHAASTELIINVIERHLRRRQVAFVCIFMRTCDVVRCRSLRKGMQDMVECSGWRVEKAFSDCRKERGVEVLEWILHDVADEASTDASAVQRNVRPRTSRIL